MARPEELPEIAAAAARQLLSVLPSESTVFGGSMLDGKKLLVIATADPQLIRMIEWHKVFNCNVEATYEKDLEEDRRN